MLSDAIHSLDTSKLTEFQLWFRVTVEDFIFSRTDYSGVVCLLKDISGRAGNCSIKIKHHVRLHAKIYKCDNKIFLGSSNLTSAGFDSNIEILAEDRLKDPSKGRVIESIENDLSPISISELEDFISKCNRFDVQKFQEQIKLISKAISKCKIPTGKDKTPPHFRIPW